MKDENNGGLYNKVRSGLKNDRRYPEPSIMCVGIGGGGCNIVSELNRKRSSVKLFCLNTDALSNAKRSEVVPVNVGIEYILENRDSGGYVEVAKKAFREDFPLIDVQVMNRADLVLLVVTLGGGTGSGGVIEMVRLLKRSDTPFKIYVVRPFEFEDNRKEIADRTIAQLRRETDQIKIYDNNEFNSIREVNGVIKKDIDSYVEGRLGLYEKMYTNWFDGLLNETLMEVLSEQVLTMNLEIDPIETELLKPT